MTGPRSWVLAAEAEAEFWDSLPLEELMADIAPLNPDEHFDIPDVTDEEWDVFVAALDE